MGPGPLRRVVAAGLTGASICAFVAPPAGAAAPQPSCPDVTATASLFKEVGPGGAYWLENIGFDGRGGMWVSELVMSQLVRFDAAGNAGTSIPISNPGASLLGPDGLMYALFGDGAAGAVPGTGQAGVVRFDPASPTPAPQPFVAGLQMANGAAFDAAGNLYVSDTTNPGVTKVRPDGTVDPTFAKAAPLAGTDGLAVADGTLYATLFSDSQSSIARIPVGDPAAYTTLTSLSPNGVDTAQAKFLDDAQVGPDGRLYVASNRGELIRVDRDTGGACVLASGLPPVDSVRFASGFPPFDPSTDAFMTSQNGQIIHVHLAPRNQPGPIVAPGSQSVAAGRPRLRLRVTPRHVRRGRVVTLHFTVRSAGPGCRAGVRVRVGHRAVKTDARGRAAVRLRFRARVLKTLTARATGCRSARTHVRVR